MNEREKKSYIIIMIMIIEIITIRMMMVIDIIVIRIMMVTIIDMSMIAVS